MFFVYLFCCTSCCIRPKTTVPTDTFYGVLPCADCSGIHYALTLNKDGTYTENVRYDGKGAKSTTHMGYFEVQDDSIVRLADKYAAEGMNRFVVDGETLRMLSIMGEPIRGALANRYQLLPEPPANYAREEQPTNFTAAGNEPFWELAIAPGAKMYFRTLDGSELDSLVTPVPPPTESANGDTLRWQATTEAGQLYVTIVRETCQDTMAGELFGYRVWVEAKTNTMKDFVTYEGCGDYR